MARRIDVTGAGGVRLAAWEFGDPPKSDPVKLVPEQPGPHPEPPAVDPHPQPPSTNTRPECCYCTA